MRNPDFRFDEAAHAYYLGTRRLPSVTQILAQLQDWSKVDPVALEAARIRGTHIHKMVELDVCGDLDEDTLAPEYTGYLQQWRKFRAEMQFKPLLCEQRVYHDVLGYAGTLDLLGMVGTHIYQVDIKTGVVPRTVGLQTAAYHEAGVWIGCVPPTAGRATLQLHADGYKFRPIETAQAYDLANFTAALNLHNWRLQNA